MLHLDKWKLEEGFRGATKAKSVDIDTTTPTANWNEGLWPIAATTLGLTHHASEARFLDSGCVVGEADNVDHLTFFWNLRAAGADVIFIPEDDVFTTPWQTTGEVGIAFDDEVWELYDGSSDWTQARDLSKDNPDKLHELQRLFVIEATRNNVLPLDDRSFERVLPEVSGKPELIEGNKQVLLPGKGGRASRASWPLPSPADRIA